MSNFSEILKGLTQRLIASPSERKLYVPIPPQNVEGGDTPPVSCAADEVYFQISLAEMFLKDRREYWRSFLPFAVTVCDFVYDGERRSVPVFVGNDLLKSIESYIGGEAVEYRNTRLVGPAPYAGGDIGVFVGLFRTKSDDLAAELLGLVNEIGNTFPVGQLNRYLELLAPLGRGLTSVLGIKDVEFRFGIRDVFEQAGARSFRPGYYALVNCPAEYAMAPAQLWVREGQLWFGDGKPTNRLTTHDYCLVRYDLRRDREVSSLPFAKRWKDIKSAAATGQQAVAETLFLQLGGELATSPDLTTRHRHDLILLYKANLERENELYRLTHRPAGQSAEPLQRGSGGGDARVAIQKAAQRLGSLPGVPAAKKSLDALALEKNWSGIMKPFDTGQHRDLDDAVVKQQLEVLADAGLPGGSPEDLLRALTYSAFHHQ